MPIEFGLPLIYEMVSIKVAHLGAGIVDVRGDFNRLVERRARHAVPLQPLRCGNLSIFIAFAGDLRRVCEKPGLTGQTHAVLF